MTVPSIIICSICNAGCRLWCTTQDWEYFTSEKMYSYYQCQDCKTLFIEHIPSEDLYHIYPSNYYSFGEPSGGIVFQIKEWLDRKYFQKLLKKIPGDELHLLDVGGGTGWLAKQIALTDSRVKSSTIIDIDSNAQHIAEKNGHHFQLGRIEDVQATRKYDLILLLNLIEHVEHPRDVLFKVAAMLTDSGICLIKTPNVNSLDAKIFRTGYWGGLHTPRHWTIYTADSFRKELAGLPLQIERLQYTQGAPFWTYSMLVKLFGKKLWDQKRPLINHFLFSPLSACFALFDFVRSFFVPTSQMFIELKLKKS